MIDGKPRPAPTSLWGRLRRDRGGIASLVVLGIIALACLLGHIVSPHPYDRVYPDYVLTPASFAAHPTPAERDGAVRTLAARMHATAVWTRVRGIASWPS
jgi:oligopeptide transport system permease protein